MKDVKIEMEKIKSQKEKEILDYNGAFKGSGGPNDEE